MAPGRAAGKAGQCRLRPVRAEFTPHAIGRVLGRSSGAVANALDRLTALGQAQLTSDKPRRYQAAQTPPAPAGTT